MSYFENFIISGSEDYCIRIWNLNTEEVSIFIY